MAILPKSTSVAVTLSSYAQSANEKIQPLVAKAQSLALTSLATTKAILDRYPPLKVAFLVSLLNKQFFLINLAKICCYFSIRHLQSRLQYSLSSLSRSFLPFAFPRVL